MFYFRVRLSPFFTAASGWPAASRTTYILNSKYILYIDARRYCCTQQSSKQRDTAAALCTVRRGNLLISIPSFLLLAAVLLSASSSPLCLHYTDAWKLHRVTISYWYPSLHAQCSQAFSLTRGRDCFFLLLPLLLVLLSILGVTRSQILIKHLQLVIILITPLHL